MTEKLLVLLAILSVMMVASVVGHSQTKREPTVWLVDRFEKDDEFSKSLTRSLKNSRHGRILKVVSSWDQVVAPDSLDMYVDLNTWVRNHFNSDLPQGLTNSWLAVVHVGSFDRLQRPLLENYWNQILLFWEWNRKSEIGYDIGNQVLEYLTERLVR